MPPDDAAVPPVTSRGGATRRVPRLLLILAGALLVARVATGVWEERHPPRVEDLVRWRSIEGGRLEARQSGKPILYDFTAEWCPPCRLMEREVFADPQAARQIESLFVPVRVLDRQREEGRNPAAVDSLQARFHVTAFPTLVIDDPKGGEPVVMPGYRGRMATLQRLVEATMPARHGRMRVDFP